MLTDYHLHLRADDDDRPPERSAFTTENVERYVAAAEDAGIEELGCSEHVYRFTDALEIWQHPFWQRQARDDLDAYCEFVRTTPLRLGLEVDFVPGAEDRIANLLDGHDFDYVVGSIHFVGDRAVDHDGYDIWETDGDADAVWRRYFETLAEAAGSGLFDILAHPDLVKMWGRARPHPERDPRFYYEPAVEAIAESGIAVEVSTAGLRKPVRGDLPGAGLRDDVRRGGGRRSPSPPTPTSPRMSATPIETAVSEMGGWGIEQIAVFERRERRLEPLG